MAAEQKDYQSELREEERSTSEEEFSQQQELSKRGTKRFAGLRERARQRGVVAQE